MVVVFNLYSFLFIMQEWCYIHAGDMEQWVKKVETHTTQDWLQ